MFLLQGLIKICPNLTRIDKVLRLQNQQERDYLRQRLMGAALCIGLVFCLLFFRLVFLQVICGQEYRRMSRTNCIRLKSIRASRGMIYDRYANLLVDNRPAFDITIVLEDAKPLDETLEKLADCIDTSTEELKKNMLQASYGVASYKPIVLKKDITRDELAIVEAHKFDLPGIGIEVEPTRNYIYPKLASHLLGYLGKINKRECESGEYPNLTPQDSVGRYGVEKSFEEFLQGKRGGRQVEVDVKGRIIRELKRVEPVPGNDLYLTLDLGLQKLAQRLLDNQHGAVVAMDPSNGDVLVMASAPGFDPNDFIGGISSKKWKALMEDSGTPMINKTIQGEYPPASTYKIVTSIAGLEEGSIDVTTSVFCSGFYPFGGRRYHCWRKIGHGNLDVVGALTHSCDVFFYITGEKLGVDKLAQYAKGCGLGQHTGVRLAHERPGLIPTSVWKQQRFKEPWQAGETLSISIGQGFNLVTPLQMAVFISAVGNGGTLYRPRLVSSVQRPDGTKVKGIEPEIIGGLPVSAENLDIVRKGLLQVVQGERGTARRIRIPGVEIAGKTGTAQVFSRKKGAKFDNDKVKRELKDHAWFVCYAPAENPTIAISVIIEHGEHGSSQAAPVAGELIRHHMDVSLTKSQSKQ